jgi:hypothetical protein
MQGKSLRAVVPAERYHSSIIQGTRLIEQDNPKHMREMRDLSINQSVRVCNAYGIWYLDEKILAKSVRNGKCVYKNPKNRKVWRIGSGDDLYCWLNLKPNVAFNSVVPGPWTELRSHSQMLQLIDYYYSVAMAPRGRD